MDLYDRVTGALLVGAISAFIVSLGLIVSTDLQRRVIGTLSVTAFLVVSILVFRYA